jgi:hypothetical protein
MNTALDYNDYLYFDFDGTISPVFIKRADHVPLMNVIYRMAHLIVDMRTGIILKDRVTGLAGHIFDRNMLLELRISFSSDDVIDPANFDYFIQLYHGIPQTLSDTASESESYNFRCGVTE